MRRNHLAAETSPYLKAHADNPVEWYPWGEEALAKARAEGKPILLSIGYSACHWCHVMAHESFEDESTAALMNRWFVNIKVDREERPDIDRIYQLAQQLITGRGGGWPLTMFLSAEQEPFFGGTYFPKETRHGLPAFREILTRVAEYHRTRPQEVREITARVAGAFEQIAAEQIAARRAPAAAPFDATPLQRARTDLAQSFDARYGGFGKAPKFPRPTSIEFCLRQADRSMAAFTLERMAEGGIYDHLGGGFARYAVDDAWTIPHFEKMLYDNGQLLGLYAAAAVATGEPLFERTALETAAWLLRDLGAPGGGFYSSLDADSEGHEGRFYVWQPEEVRALLREPEYAAFAHRYGLDGPANFEGRWHLRVRLDTPGPAESRPAPHPDTPRPAPHPSAPDAAAPHPTSARDAPAAEADWLESARSKLLAQRNLRIWPARDEKILTAWNALTIKGLAIAARHLDRPDLAEAATRAVDVLFRELFPAGRLLAVYTAGHARLGAYLDDHAFLADALLELLQARWRSRDLEFARALAELMLAQFEDPADGGFFFTAADHERLIHRSKSFGDEAVPSGNGVGARVLWRLGLLLGETRYLDAAERTLRAGWSLLLEHPEAHMSLALALEDMLAPTRIVILRGEPDEIRPLARSLAAQYAPTRMVFAIPAAEADLPPALAAKAPGAGPVAYVCEGMTCSAPIHDREELERVLATPGGGT